MNDTSMTTRSDARADVGQRFASEIARVGALDHRHARVLPQLPVQLPVADVQGDDVARAALQQHVGEAAGRRADVERQHAR